MIKFLASFFMWLSVSTIALAQVASHEAAPAVVPSLTSLLSLVVFYFDMVAQAMLGLTIVATAAARVIPGTKDDVLVESVTAKLMKFLSYLPTFGINPRTKALESELKALKDQPKV